jgi:hypothetical protein
MNMLGFWLIYAACACVVAGAWGTQIFGPGVPGVERVMGLTILVVFSPLLIAAWVLVIIYRALSWLGERIWNS